MAMAKPIPPSHATSWRPEEEGRRYELGRPSYPDTAIEVLADQLGLRPGARVVDVAAGTGKLTRLLERTGAEVIAVEPMPGMRAQLRLHAPGALVTSARAEDLPLRSEAADAVTVAQAFHWFDVAQASREIRRVLRPGGHLALVTNRRHTPEEWHKDLWRVLRRYEALAPRPPAARNWRAALDLGDDFGTFDRFEVHNEQRFESLEEFDARFASISFVILLAEADRRALIRDLHAVVADVDPLVVPLRTEIEVATRRG
jgi:SAM-dependent methyltransferase